jgi:hypothetical protein
MFDLTPVTVLMRWMHLASMAVLVGGMVFARLVLARSVGAVEDRVAVAYRPLAIGAALGLVISGTYQLYSSTGHSVRYHVLFGVKMALALHVFSVAMLIVQPRNPRRTRMMTGVAISGLLIVLISALLKQIY